MSSPEESKAWWKHIPFPLLSPALPCSPDSQQKHDTSGPRRVGDAPGTQLPSGSWGPVPRRSWLRGGGVGKEPSTGPFTAFTRKGCCRQGKGGKDRKSKMEWQGHPTPPRLAFIPLLEPFFPPPVPALPSLPQQDLGRCLAGAPLVTASAVPTGSC